MPLVPPASGSPEVPAPARETQASVQARLDEGTVYLQGFDAQGRPVVYIDGSKIVFRWFADNEGVQRYLCYVLDAAISSMSAEQRSSGKITVVFDLSGALLGRA